MAIRYPIVFKTDTKGLDKADGALKKFSKVAAAASAATVAAVGGIAVQSVRAFADFDSALNKSLAIMGDVSGAMEKEMSDAAREVAKTTSFSAEQAAESFYFLASAGLDAEQQIEALPQVAAFAQAGMFDMATATDIATDAQSALGLASDDAAENLDNLTRVTDVFVAAATLGNTSVEQLGSAMTSKAGTALQNLSKDVEEGAAALTVFADQGIKGERAGTLLTNTLIGLEDAAEKAPSALENLGVQVYDSDGAMRNMADIVGDLETGLDGMSTQAKSAALSQLGFGKQTTEGINALLGNSEALADYEEQLRSAGGITQEVAQKQLDTLNAQFGLLKDSVTDAGIEIGGVLAPHIQTLVEGLIPLVQDLTPKLGDALRNIESAAQGAGERLEVVGSIFSRLSQDENPGSAVDFLARQFGMLGDNIVENLGDAFVKFMQFRQQLTEAILEALPGIIDGFLTFLPQLVTFLAEDVLPMIFNQLAGIAETLIEIISEALPKIIEAIGEVLPMIADAILEFLPKILETLLGLIPQLLEAGLDFFSALITALGEVVPQVVEMVAEFVPEFIETIVEMLPQLIESALEFFNGLVTALVDTIPLIIDAYMEALPDILGAIMDALPQLIEAGLELFFGIVTALVDTIPEILTAIIDMIPEITTQLLDMLPDIIDAGMDLFFGIINGLIEATPDILEAVIELIPEITGALLGEMPKLIEAGFDILSGIAEGILENLPTVAANLASSIGSAIRGGVESWFGISSPSKVFMGIGEELINGLAKGVEDSKGLAVDASLNMASNVALATDSAFATVPRAATVDQFGQSSGFSGRNAGGANVNITINAGAGTDPVAVGRSVVDAIKRYESVNGKVFATA